MHALRALQKLEAQVIEQLATIYGVEEDELPIEVDLLSIYNLDESEREGKLVSVGIIFAFCCL